MEPVRDPQGIVPIRALVDRFVEQNVGVRAATGPRSQPTHTLYQNYDTDRIVELVDSEVDAVRIKALDVLSRRWASLRHEEGQAATMNLLAPSLERALSETNPTVGQAAAQFLAGVGIMSSADGRSVFLRRPWENRMTFSLKRVSPERTTDLPA